jgi:hypothetical protein
MTDRGAATAEVMRQFKGAPAEPFDRDWRD